VSQIREANKKKLLEALLSAGSLGLTTEAASALAGIRFGGRVHELRAEGWEIVTLPRKGTEKARYVLKGKRPSTLAFQKEMHFEKLVYIGSISGVQWWEPVGV
jgi:hypothetical protein